MHHPSDKLECHIICGGRQHFGRNNFLSSVQANLSPTLVKLIAANLVEQIQPFRGKGIWNQKILRAFKRGWTPFLFLFSARLWFFFPPLYLQHSLTLLVLGREVEYIHVLLHSIMKICWDNILSTHTYRCLHTYMCILTVCVHRRCANAVYMQLLYMAREKEERGTLPLSSFPFIVVQTWKEAVQTSAKPHPGPGAQSPYRMHQALPLLPLATQARETRRGKKK